MLGDGMVSFGRRPSATPSTAGTRRRRRRSCSSSASRPSTCSAAGVKSRSPVGVVEVHRRASRRRLADAVELVDEVHVPRRAAELAVGRRPQAGVAPAARTTSRDRLVLDRAQLGVVDLAGGVSGRGRRAGSAGAAGCRRGRRGTAGCHGARVLLERGGAVAPHHGTAVLTGRGARTGPEEGPTWGRCGCRRQADKRMLPGNGRAPPPRPTARTGDLGCPQLPSCTRA